MNQIVNDPILEQESRYELPYHWFPVERLKQYAYQEKRRIIFGLIDAFGQKPIRRYLDVGCGDGKWTSEIDSFLKPTKTIGIDISERAIGFAKLIVPSVQFEIVNAGELQFPDNKFDLVTAIEVIEHIDESGQDAMLHEIHRVLKENGLLILTTPSWNLKLPKFHFRHYSEEELRGLLVRNRFEVCTLRGQALPYYGSKRVIRSYMNRLPFIWKLWKYTYAETDPSKASGLILAARPIK